jgi:aspartyl/asparaginyl beta-hydroxylase/L-proline 3-hydroxylase-like protein
MRTRYVTTIPLDPARLAKDLEHCASFHYSEAYSDYLFGGAWKSAMLWARGGDSGDGVVTNYAYDRPASFTEYGRALPYLQEVISSTADLSRLNFARLAVVANSVIIPHRDLLELGDLADADRNAHRVHIPLATNDSCFFSEGNSVFRMRVGEVWFLDASQIHSVASLSDEPRVHLILDFVDRPAAGPLLSVGGGGGDGGGGEDIPAGKLVRRPPLPDSDRTDLLRLAEVLTVDTFGEVFSIVIKKHYRYDGGDDFAWDMMTAIAGASKDPAVLPHAQQLRTYFTLERSA